MKILVIIPSLRRGGAERVVSLLTQEWAKTHEVLLAVFDSSGSAYPHGGTLLNLGYVAQQGVVKKAVNALSRVRRLVEVMHRERPARIISFMESANFPAIVAALFSRYLTRLSVSVRCNPQHSPSYYRFLIPLLYRAPRRVIAVSAGVQQALANMGVPAVKLHAIPNPVTVQADNVKGSPAGLPKSFVLAVGRLHREKGFDRLLNAFAHLGQPDMELVILGEGAERANLARLANELGIEQRVHLVGNVADPAIWYRHALCFVLSSRYEGWPNVLMEAMANGCPVVSFDCNYGPSEIIENEVSGLLVKEGDIAALTRAISRVLDDEPLRRQLSNSGKERSANFTVGNMARYWLEE